VINALGQPQRILLIGGTSDIGLAIVSKLATRDTEVVLAGRHLDALHAAGAHLGDAVRAIDVVQLDVADTASHAHVLGEQFSRDIDVVILAAGVLPEQAQAMADPHSAVESLAVNGFGAASLTLLSHRLLAKQGHGQLVLLSTVAAARPRPSNFIYGAGKVMLDFLGQGLVESPDPRVNVLLVRPGFVHTKMTVGMSAAPFSVSAARVAEGVAQWSASARRSRVIWVPSLLANVSRVLTMLPLAVLKRLDR